MRRFIFITLGLALVGCTVIPPNSPNDAPQSQNVPLSENNTPAAESAGQMADFPDLGPAPELTNTVWLNTDHPLRLKDLRGKVVLLEMWTFDCINCQHVVPSLRSWYQKYADKGLVIIGNHFPEFDFERDLSNLTDAVKRLGILYPVAQDNDGATWSAYHNAYWPTAYLIDKRGQIRFRQIGEGNYAATESAIQDLLNEPG